MNRILLYLFVLAFLELNITNATQIDIGIFESAEPDKIEIKIRPDFDIESNQTLTGILYTVRWDGPFVNISTQYVPPFYVQPQGGPEFFNGYYYQVFASTPLSPLQMNAGEEYLLSSFTFINGNCSNFQIIEDEWTQINNGNVYLELLGIDVTGIIYEPDVFLGSFAESVIGVDTVFLGNSTGPMLLGDYNGTIQSWQRQINGGPWNDISGTSGLTSYSETPASMGNFGYRVKVQNGSCPVVYSDAHYITVVDDIEFNLKIFLEGPFQSGQMNTTLNDLELIPMSQPYNSPPWNYPGDEAVIEIPEDAVDWVLVELRESSGDASTATPDNTILRRAGFLMNNGQIKELDGINDLDLILSLTQNLYLVIYHRNHLPVISGISPSYDFGVCNFNFSSDENQALGGDLGHKELVPGIWGSFAGDGNADKTVNMLDKTVIWESQTPEAGYLMGDYNLEGQVNNPDKNDYWLINFDKSSQVPE